MADQAIVLRTTPALSVKLVDAGTTCPGLLLASPSYLPSEGDLVTVLLQADGSALVLGAWSQ